MRIEELEPDLLVLVGETYSSNSTAFIKDGAVLLVDGMASRRDAEELRQFIELELNKRVRFIICTHYFSVLMAALKLFPESQIIAHKNYSHTFDSERFRTEEERASFVEPDIQISDGIKIKWGRYTLDVFYNPGHTMSTLNVDIAEADLIMVGDTIVGNMVYLAYSSPEMLRSALTRLRRRGRSRLIQSHQGLRSSRAADSALYYLNSLGEKVISARRGTRAPEESILEIGLQSCLERDVEASAFEDIFHRRNLESIIERKLFA